MLSRTQNLCHGTTSMEIVCEQRPSGVRRLTPDKKKTALNPPVG